MAVFKFLSHIMNNVRIVIPSIYIKIFIPINSYQIENPLSFSKLVFCHFKYTNMYYLFVVKKYRNSERIFYIQLLFNYVF